jgi:pimeloyl-ACP methyl ester carboxylesterase
MNAARHIILVHGLGRTALDMLLMERRLSKLLPESAIHRFEYHSRRLRIAESAEQLARFIEQRQIQEPASFVGHSLGGIVVRALDAAGNAPVPLQRLVTLGSPHMSATIARWLAPYSLPSAVFGPVLHELGNLSLPPSPTQLEVGCIVGGLNNRFGFLPIFGEDNDGLVLAREALLPGCKAAKRVALLHAVMPFTAKAAQLSARFIDSGEF